MNIKQRLKTALFYLGFTPLFPKFLFRNNKKNAISTEYFYALAILFILNLTILIGLLVWIFGNQAFQRFFPTTFTKLMFGGTSILCYPFIILFCAGIILWFIYFFRMLAGINIRPGLFINIQKSLRIFLHNLLYYS